MNKNIIYLLWIFLLSMTVVVIFCVYYFKNEITRTRLDLNVNTSYRDMLLECPNDVNVSDRFACISKLTNDSFIEADALANKLILQAPIRLKEIATDDKAPMSWEYGGEDFLINLPMGIKQAQEARDKYIDATCTLDSMRIFGSSGMDLEQEACRYFYIKQYINILKNLELGVKS